MLYLLMMRYNRYLPAKRWIHNNIINKLAFGTKHRTLSIVSLQEGMRVIIEKIHSGVPFMLGRYGFTEIRNISRISTQKKREKLFEQLYINAGFYPRDISLLPRFIELYHNAEQNCDILLPWSFTHDIANNERIRVAGLSQCSLLCPMDVSGITLGYPAGADITQDDCYHNYQYFVNNSYMSALEDKKVLVIHPFKKTIYSQYKKLVSLGILKKCKDFIVLQAVQSIGRTVNGIGGGVKLFLHGLMHWNICMMR